MAIAHFIIKSSDSLVAKCVREIDKRRLVKWEIYSISIKIKMCFLKFLRKGTKGYKA